MCLSCAIRLCSSSVETSDVVGGSAKLAGRENGDQREPDGQPKSCGPVQSSLSGHGKTLMFVNVAPGMADAGETLCSLQFAARVRGVELGPARRHVEAGSEIGELRAELARLKAQVRRPPSSRSRQSQAGSTGSGDERRLLEGDE